MCFYLWKLFDCLIFVSIHAVDENGTSLEGFPKEGRKMLAVAKDKQQLQIVTTINGALAGYLVGL